MTKKILSRVLPAVATAALLFPAGRKLGNGEWREELGMTYQLGDRDFGASFFLLVGLIELTMAGLILWPRTRILAGMVMAGFFVGALVFNVGLRVDQDLLPDDRPTLSTLIPLDVSHVLLGLAVATLAWMTSSERSANT